MDERMRSVAESGDTNGLYNCIRNDANVLRRIEEAKAIDTPLHIAAAKGHADFAIAIMYLKPSLARKLNQDMYSPIHLALQNKHEEVVLRLLAVDKDLIRVKGKEGYTAFHHVVEDGNLGLLTQFVKDCPECIDDVTIRDETALHIAAKNRRFEALEILVRWLQRNHIYGKVSKRHLLKSKDKDGNTVLHIAASHTNPQMIELLLECKVLDKMETNTTGLTALGITEKQREGPDKDLCLKILRSMVGGTKARSILPRVVRRLIHPEESKITILEKLVMGLAGPITHMSPEGINTLIIGLTLIITAIYATLLSPPGGLWQAADTNTNKTSSPAPTHIVGTSVMDPVSFQVFFGVNYVVFAFATGSIVVLIQFVTNSSGMGIITEVIASLFTFSFVSAWWVIVPANVDFKRTFHIPLFSNDLIRKLSPPIIFFVLLVGLEVLRRLFLIFRRWYYEV